MAELLIEKQWTLAVAESCTGGLVGHWITEESGSSAYFMGGVQAYSNEVKMRVLGVPQSVLDVDGAVSEASARAMAEGARALLKTTLAVSITGIAGPAGGSDDKPCGLTYCAVAGPEDTLVARNIWTGDRSENKEASAREAIRLVLQYIDTHASI